MQRFSEPLWIGERGKGRDLQLTEVGIGITGEAPAERTADERVDLTHRHNLNRRCIRYRVSYRSNHNVSNVDEVVVGYLVSILEVLEHAREVRCEVLPRSGHRLSFITGFLERLCVQALYLLHDHLRRDAEERVLNLDLYDAVLTVLTLRLNLEVERLSRQGPDDGEQPHE